VIPRPGSSYPNYLYQLFVSAHTHLGRYSNVRPTNRALALLLLGSLLAACAPLSSSDTTTDTTKYTPSSEPGVYSVTRNQVESFELMTFPAFSPDGLLIVSDPTRNALFSVSKAGVVKFFAGSTEPGFTDGQGTAASFNRPTGLAYSPDGTLYVADTGNNLIRKISKDGSVETFAGSTEPGFTDGQGTAASFNRPTGLAYSPDGTLYVADTGNNLIRKISKDGSVETFAGSTEPGFTDGQGTAASFNRPTGLAYSPDGTLYVADTGNNVLRGVSSSGEVFRVAGFLLGEIDSDSAVWAMYSAPVGVAIDAEGSLYMSDTMNRRVVKLTDLGPEFNSFGFAGSGEAMVSHGKGTLASFVYPTGLAVSSDGNLYIGDFGKYRIRVSDPDHVVVAPDWSEELAVNPQKYQGSLLLPEGVSAASDGTLYVADTLNSRIAKVSPDGKVSTFAGTGIPGFADGSTESAQFAYPSDVFVAKDGSIYVADTGNNRIRLISPTGKVSTIAGGTGDDTGPDIGSKALGSFIVRPISVELASSGYVYVADWGNHRVVRFTVGGNLELVAGSLPKGYEDGVGELAKFRRPSGIALSPDGSLFVSDATNGYIRSINQGRQTSTVIGTGPSANEPLVGSPLKTSLNMPHGLVMYKNTTLLISDFGFNRILSFDGSTVKVVSGGVEGLLDGPLNEARFYYPSDISVGPDGAIYVADTGNNEIRRLVLP